MMAAELIGIREAQEVTKQRKAPKKSAQKPKGKSKAKKESTDESEVELNDTSDEDSEILDCIVVEK